MKWNRFFLPSVGYGFPVGINFGGFLKQVPQTGRLMVPEAGRLR